MGEEEEVAFLTILKHLKSLAEKLVPMGYEDETGFHYEQAICEKSSAPRGKPGGAESRGAGPERCPPTRCRKGSNGTSACFRA
jgi:hypothetical protein